MPTMDAPDWAAMRSAGPPDPQAMSSTRRPGLRASHWMNWSCSGAVIQPFWPKSSCQVSRRISR